MVAWTTLAWSAPRVYVSLTASPSRIGNVGQVLESLDLELVEKVYLALPRVFSRDPRPYQIPPSLAENPRVEIVWVEEDLGPITKLIPVAEKLQREDPSAWLVTIDDDILYQKGTIASLVLLKKHYPEAFVGAIGVPISNWGISDFPGQDQTRDFKSGARGIYAVDMTEGFGSVLFDVARVNTTAMRRYAGLSWATRLSDDIVIAYTAAQDGILRIRVDRAENGVEGVVPLSSGLQSDALHLGAGTGFSPSLGHNINRVKYQIALMHLKSSERRRKISCPLSLMFNSNRRGLHLTQ